MAVCIASQAEGRLPDVSVGDTLTIHTTANDELTGAYAAVAGSPVLVEAGAVVAKLNDVARHPRTAVGIAGRRVIWVVVDGREPGVSIGMSHHELAALMLSLGCTSAINLDGGGSSTMWFQGQVVNRPSSGRPREVGNALVVRQRVRGR